MHIVHAIGSSRFAGVEQYVARLASAQAAAGHRVQVLGGAPEPMARAVGPAVALYAAERLADLRRGLRALPGRPDVVNAHMTTAEVATLLQPHHPPVVATRHFAAARGSTAPRRVLLRAVPPLLAAQISVSRHVADAIGQPSTVVHAGVPDRPALPGRPVRSVVVLGRLEREKQTTLAIEAFAASRLAERGWDLSIVGDGACRAELERQAARLGLRAAVRFHGHLDEPRRILATAAVLLAPCPVEAFGLAVVEAMADGLPVVAAAAGGHLETVGAACPDLLFDPGDAAGAGALLRALAADPGRASRAGAALQHDQRRRFTLDQQVRDTDRVYERVT